MERRGMRGSASGTSREVRTDLPRPPENSHPQQVYVRIVGCSEAWGVRGFVHLNQWTVNLPIPIPRRNAKNGPEDVHSTAPDREL